MSFESTAHYLNTTSLSVPTNVDVDLGSGTVNATMTSFSLKELICSLLAGNGLKLPNLQICLKINIGRLLGLSGLPSQLQAALANVENALDDFIAHTNIDNVLGRLNAALAEFAAIANMINFCGSPIQPISIPNVLRDIFGSFIGKGKELLDKLGSMLDSDIGGCISTSGSVNFGIFQGGLLKELGEYLDEFGNFTGPQADLDRIVNELNTLASDLQNLMKFENNFKSTSSNGGSVFTSGPQRVHTGVGVAIDTANMTLADGQRYASNLKGLYDNLSQYEIDEAGNSVFDYILEPELIAKLAAQDDPTVPIAERDPVYDHCGRIIGYTTSVSQPVSTQSTGAPVENIVQPATTGLKESGAVVAQSPSTTTNLAKTNTIVKTSVPQTTKGKSGDKRGDIATDGDYIYIAHADYDGETDIWTRAKLESWV